MDEVAEMMFEYKCSIHSLKDLRQFINEVRPDFNRWKDQAQYLQRLNPTGLGENQAKMILVGDEVNLRETWRCLPFDGGKSADYLRNCLKQIDTEGDTSIYFLNQADDPIKELKWQLIDGGKSLFNQKVVALGEKASAWLRKNNIPHFKIRHPTYQQRFKSGETSCYIASLRRIYHASN